MCLMTQSHANPASSVGHRPIDASFDSGEDLYAAFVPCGACLADILSCPNSEVKSLFMSGMLTAVPVREISSINDRLLC